MYRRAFLLGAIALPFLLGSCFVLADFWVASPVVAPGEKTAAYFVLYPEDRSSEKHYQFVIVGVDDPTQVGIGKATWGINGTFGGPQPMVVQPNLDDALVAASCSRNGIDFANITGMTWKGFTTATKVADKGKVGIAAQIRVGLTAKGTATPDTRTNVLGATGVWYDDGDAVLESNGDDLYFCFGISTSSVFIS